MFQLMRCFLFQKWKNMNLPAFSRPWTSSSERVSSLKIRAGSEDTLKGGCKAKIQEIIKHPGWSIHTKPDNDIALGLLDRYLEFGPTIGSVKIPAAAALKPTTDDVEVTSWGADQRDGMYPTYRGHTLKVYCSHLYSRRACNAVFKNYGAKVTANFMCVSTRGYRAPCTRDTGAPAVAGGILYGLASWGIRKSCGSYRHPAVFSYIGSPENWLFITNVTANISDKNHITRNGPSKNNPRKVLNTLEVPGSHEQIDDDAMSGSNDNDGSGFNISEILPSWFNSMN